jgi:hypothetical protein
MRWGRRIALSFALLTLAATGLVGQEAATLAGRVTDPNGLAVVKASVVATNIDTGIAHSSESNEVGLYRIPSLQPGSYRISVKKDGFAEIIRSGVELHVQDIITLNFALRLGSARENITVSGDVPLVNTESAAVSTVVTREQVENMPLNGRSLQSLITLTPGIVQVPANSGEPGQFSANGQRTYSNYFTVDGVSANAGITASSATSSLGSTYGGAQAALTQQGTTQSLVSVDALQEFRIQTSNYAPEFGRSPGAQVELVTRSGTNQFHGTLFEYLRNDVFDANDWFANNAGRPRAPERQNDFGGTLGGPVRLPGYNGHDHTFFFFSYEGLRLRQPQFTVSSVPSLSTRQSVPVALQPLLNAYPLPTGANLLNSSGQPTGLAQYNDAHSDPSSLDALGIRLDHTFTSRFSMFGRYSNTPSSATTRSLSTLTPGATNTQTVTTGATATLTSTLINEARFNYSRVEASNVRILDSFGGGIPLLGSSLLPSFESGRPALFAFGLSLTGGVPFLNSGPAAHNLQRQINLVDSLSFTHGSHAMKFGTDYRRIFPVYGPREYTESLLISNLTDLQNGKIGTTTIQSQLSDVRPVFANFSLYSQDTWRASRRLTLTYGLRWELNPTPHNSNGPDPSVLTGLDSPTNFALAPTGTPVYPTRYNNFAPRLGAAFQLRQKQGWETVLRGGVGVFYDLGTSEAAEGFGGFPYVASKSVFGAIYPLTAAQLAPPVVSMTPPYSGNFFEYDPATFNLPYTVQWNVAAEQALGPRQSLTASYVGNLSRRNLRQQEFNKPNASFPLIAVVFRSNSTSDYDALQLQYQRRLSQGLQVLASYTWSHALDDNSIEIQGLTTTPIRGNSSFDVRHNLAAAVSYDFPTPPEARVMRAVFGNWGTDAIVHARSAAPVDIVSNVSVIIGVQQFSIRPDVVPGVPFYLSDPTVPGGRRFNPAAFAKPPAGRDGTLGRNVLRGLPANQVDFALRRQFRLTERLKLQFRTEAFNILNHPSFGGQGTNSTVPATFGVPNQMLGRSLGGLSPIYQIGGPRSLQFALKLSF